MGRESCKLILCRRTSQLPATICSEKIFWNSSRAAKTLFWDSSNKISSIKNSFKFSWIFSNSSQARQQTKSLSPLKGLFTRVSRILFNLAFLKKSRSRMRFFCAYPLCTLFDVHCIDTFREGDKENFSSFTEPDVSQTSITDRNFLSYWIKKENNWNSNLAFLLIFHPTYFTAIN